MEGDQVKYSDLIADDVVKGLELLNKALQDIKTTMAGVKEEAASLGVSLKNVSTATREQQQATAQNAASAERLSKRMKDLNDEERKVEEIKRRYKKLTDEQIQAVNAFQQALRGSTAQQLAAVNAIDVESKSYNELNAMYNALKDSLNAMTIAERQNTEAGKAMTAQSARIYDTMNELQKSTGKYTLQVGKYRAAFDGLGYSFQQILREAPSALNFNQFFLAISNNIPMFLDQLKAYKNEQAEIKANLDQMTKGTKEYAEQQEKVVSVRKKLGQVLLSWQSLVLVGLMVLRNMDRIIAGINSLFSNLTKEQKMLKAVNEEAASSIGGMTAKYVALQKEWQNLKAEDMPGWLEQHKNDWSELGETIDDAKKAEDFYVNNTAAVQEAIDKRARSIAAMKIAAEKYEEAFNKEVEAENAVANRSASTWNRIKQILMGYSGAKYSWTRNYLEKTIKEDAEAYAEDMREEAKALREEATKLITTFVLPEESKPTGQKEKKEKKGKEPKDSRVSGSFNNSFNGVTSADLLVAEAKAMKDKGDDALAEIQLWYDKKVAIANASYEKEKENLTKSRADKNQSLTENVNEANIFIAKYNDILDQLNKDHAAGALSDDEFNAEKAKLENQFEQANALVKNEGVERQRIKDYYDKMEIVAEEAHQNELLDIKKQYNDKLFKQEQKRFKERQDADKRRFDLEKHNSIEQAKFNMEQEIASKQWQIDHAKELQLSEEQLAVLKEEVEWLNKKYNQGNYNAKRGNTGNYSNIMDVLFGEKITNEQVSAINSVFDQAKEALNSWMDARKAAADQAKELADDEVSAAENALNREIELRNQGYANNVALRERELADAKEKQKQAVEEQKKIAQQQILLDAALQTSSLITATANIIKQFPNPLVWGPMLATMWGSFAFAKIKAYQASTKSIQFREGGVMMLEGGSHESGHDVNLGIGPDGSNLRAEGGEYFAVINKRNSRKYGSEIPAVVNALNSGMFEDRYIKTSDAVGMMGNVGLMGNVGEAVDLSAVESGVGELVRQGESRWTVEGEYRVERYKNRVRRVKIS